MSWKKIFDLRKRLMKLSDPLADLLMFQEK